MVFVPTTVEGKNLNRKLCIRNGIWVQYLVLNPFHYLGTPPASAMEGVKDKHYVLQSITLGLFRSDYLMQCTEANRIKQVEFNTIASSFGAISSNLPAMSRYRHVLCCRFVREAVTFFFYCNRFKVYFDFADSYFV